MLCNYVVASGYQLCLKKNDTKRLLVLCCDGACSFRLWASWMGDEQSLHIKSMKPDHNCARNLKMGSIMIYWIGSHFTKKIMHRRKLSHRQFRLMVMTKFGIDVSVGQCKKAKKYALRITKGDIKEHYARLWSYCEEIRRSNPGSTMKININPMPDGTNYFSKFFVCFDGLKKAGLMVVEE